MGLLALLLVLVASCLASHGGAWAGTKAFLNPGDTKCRADSARITVDAAAKTWTIITALATSPTAAPPTAAAPSTAAAPGRRLAASSHARRLASVTETYNFRTLNVTAGETAIQRCDQLINRLDPTDIKYMKYDVNAAGNILVVSMFDGLTVRSCPATTEDCGAFDSSAATGDSVVRYQMCKIGLACPAVDAATGAAATVGAGVTFTKNGQFVDGTVEALNADGSLSVKLADGSVETVAFAAVYAVNPPPGGGWFTGIGSPEGSIDYTSSNRVTFGVLASLGMLLVVGLVVGFRAKIGEYTGKVGAIVASKGSDMMIYVAAGCSVLLFLLCAISTGMPVWSKSDLGSMGPFSICPTDQDCVDTIAHENNAFVADAVIAVRLFMMVAVLLTIAAAGLAVAMALKMVDNAKANFGFYISLGISFMSFFGLCAWAAFHNDVLGAEATALGYELTFGPSFDLAVAVWILALPQAAIFYSLYGAAAGKATGGASV